MGKKKVAVVTGGAGFIGSHMVDHLIDQGYEVRAIDNLVCGRESNVEHHKTNADFRFDSRDLRVVKPDDSLFKGVDYVFHFAGIGDIVPSIENPVDYLSCNVMGTVHALEASRHSNVKRFIYAASSSCYGLAKELPTSESAPMAPEYPYALSKYQGEQAVIHWSQVYKLPTVSLRLFNVFGPRSRTTGAYGSVFGVFLKQKLEGKPLTVVGDGNQKRDFIFVLDVARAFRMAAESDVTGKAYNVGADNPQTVNRIVELLESEKVNLPKRPGEPDCTWADISAIKRDIGWKPEIPFEQGVAEVLEKIDYWRDAPLWDPDSIKDATATWFEMLKDRGN